MLKKLFKGCLLLCTLLFCPLLGSAEGTAVISDGVFIGDQDVSGMTADEAQAYVESEVETLAATTITIQMGDDSVTATWADLGLTWTNTDLVQEISELGTTGNIIKRYKEQKDLENQSTNYEIEYELDEDSVEAFVESLSAYNSEPVEGSIYMDSNGSLCVEGGTDGMTLDVDATLVSLKEYLSTWESGDALIQATADTVSPTLTAELLSQMTDVLGTATTSYASSTSNRAQNVQNGTSKINGTLLMPGESFSVTEAVAPFTEENGYALAASYEAGQVVESYGGGICQVSTTLYNAVLKAELQVDQRHNHTMLVSYVDPSKDAAIAEGLMDFVFTNSLDYPVYIAGSAYSGTLTFTIYGVETRASNRTIELVSETISQTDPASNITLSANTSQNVGYLVQVQSAHQGLSAVLWKNIYIDGVLTDTVQVNSSTYTASPAIYEVGVATSNTALSSALYTAIAANDLSQVQYLITYGVASETESEVEQTETTQSETTQTETAVQSETTQTETSAQTETTAQTETAAQTEAATQTEASADTTAEATAETSGETVVVE
ncbi:MAG: VanW family protein [Lachnospiraceae bacterium]|nr:VanW family protein [Lachnospiraceae bacterium]